MLEWYYYLLLVGVGFAVGFINTVAGGGSLLALPTLIFLGLPSAVANGTNRVAVVFQSVMALAGFKSKGVTTYPFSIYLGLSALLGSILGAYVAIDIKGETFNRILSVVMVVVVLIIIFKPKVRLDEMQERLNGKYLWLSVAVFFLFGIYGGFINAGLGFLMMIFNNSVNRMNLVRTNATKAVVVMFYMTASLLIFAYYGKVHWEMGLVLAIGNGAGAWVASRFSVRKGDGFIKGFLVVSVIAMAIKLWFF